MQWAPVPVAVFFAASTLNLPADKRGRQAGDPTIELRTGLSLLASDGGSNRIRFVITVDDTGGAVFQPWVDSSSGSCGPG